MNTTHAATRLTTAAFRASIAASRERAENRSDSEVPTGRSYIVAASDASTARYLARIDASATHPGARMARILHSESLGDGRFEIVIEEA